MKQFVILIVVLVCTQNLFSKEIPPKERADSLAKVGVMLINKGLYNEAIEVFDDVMRLDNSKIEYPYEKALAFYQKKMYDSAIVILDSIRKLKNVNENIYQLLGSSYAFNQQNQKSRDIFIEGLNKFPNSGRLYYELGITEYTERNQKNAMYSWEKGVSLDPEFPNNYFQLSYYYDIAKEYAWSLLYAEIFMNISENLSRVDYLSKSMYSVYNKAFFNLGKDSVVRIKFITTTTSTEVTDLKKIDDLPLEVAIDAVMKSAAESVMPKDTNFLTVKQLHQIRSNFIKIWFKEKWDKNQKVALFTFWKKLSDQKLFEAYNYWVFKKGSELEFLAYASKNKSTLEKLGKWMDKNRFVIDKKNYTCKIK